MRPVDEKILDYLNRTRRAKVGGLWMKPNTLARNISTTRSYVSTRLQVLVENGAVERDDQGFYRITDSGTDILSRI